MKTFLDFEKFFIGLRYSTLEMTDFAKVHLSRIAITTLQSCSTMQTIQSRVKVFVSS